MRLIVLQQARRGEESGEGYAVRQFWFGETEAPTADAVVDLLLLDIRFLSHAAIRAALARVRHLHEKSGVRRAVMIVGAEPTLEQVVAAIRAGIHDVVAHLATLRDTLRLFRAALPADRSSRQTRAALMAVARLLIQPLALRGGGGHAKAELRRVEQKLELLAREEVRIQGLRDMQTVRERQITRQFQRLQEEQQQLQAAQKDSVAVTRASAETGVEAELAVLFDELTKKGQELEARTQALKLREQMLQDMEVCLLQHAPLSDGAVAW